ncbi:hypothetical protein NG798_13495 [Ancylothrix sp. C2]|uniref:hypothetical protein n=1 Tax=Ancylothrix sp. D3o TaxID=2953691 RepID=UPI0021BA728F|nr:hypothetical protein [Ancylothrix sp. D3o]MCT7950808.1 hypothetical protein [Ancylothrix sp. D3o]
MRSGDVAGAITQIKEGLKCSQSQEVMQRLGALLASPESEPVLRVFADLLQAGG